MKAWVMPAPAPWARTKHACAPGGRNSSADTSLPLSTCSFSGCGLTAFIALAACLLTQYRVVVQDIFPDRFGLNGAEQYPRGLQIGGLDAQGDDLAHRGL